MCVLVLFCAAARVPLSYAQEEAADSTENSIEYERVHIPLEKEKYLTLKGFLKGLLKEFDLEMPEGIGDSDRKIDISGIKGFIAVKTISATLGPKLNAEIDRGMLVLTYKREDALELKSAVRRSIVKVLLRLFQTSSNPLTIRESRYGIKKVNTHKDGNMTVLLIHGIDSGPSCFTDVIESFREKWNMYAFRYPNDQAIAVSAAFLSEELEGGAYQQLCVLTHSMGALVIREYVSTPELYKTAVHKICMAAPPNHGSRIAGLRHALEYAEAFKLVTAENRKWRDALAELTSDGLGRAGDDLKPGSLFLDRLGKKQIPRGISYAVIAGDRALISASQHKELVRWLNTKKENISNTALQAAYHKVVRDIAATEEVIHGKGDMAVTVESAKLKGAEFFRIFPRNHITMLKKAENNPVFPAIETYFAAKEKKQ